MKDQLFGVVQTWNNHTTPNKLAQTLVLFQLSPVHSIWLEWWQNGPLAAWLSYTIWPAGVGAEWLPSVWSLIVGIAYLVNQRLFTALALVRWMMVVDGCSGLRDTITLCALLSIMVWKLSRVCIGALFRRGALFVFVTPDPHAMYLEHDSPGACFGGHLVHFMFTTAFTKLFFWAIPLHFTLLVEAFALYIVGRFVVLCVFMWLAPTYDHGVCRTHGHEHHAQHATEIVMQLTA
jgi:hypothetical protein